MQHTKNTLIQKGTPNFLETSPWNILVWYEVPATGFVVPVLPGVCCAGEDECGVVRYALEHSCYPWLSIIVTPRP